MRVFYLANNWLGLQILKLVSDSEAEMVGLAIHTSENARFRNEIVTESGLDQGVIFDGSQLNEPAILERIAALSPDIGVSVLFGYILKPDFLALFPKGCLNLHPSFLPFNRGFHPNVWSIVERTPAGVTLHHIDEGIDTGDIIAQREVTVRPTDTGESLHRRLERAALSLFKDTWPAIQADALSPTPQDPSAGTFHLSKQLQTLDEIHLDKEYSGQNLIDILRARTFPPHAGAYFRHHGKRIFIRVALQEEDRDSDVNFEDETN